MTIIKKTGLILALSAALAVGGCGYIESLGTGEGGEASAIPPAFTTAEAGSIAALVEAIPASEVPELDLEMALTLVAMPLSCLDRPHAAPRDRSTYLDEFVAARRPGYERNRSFYGCWDWHSAVNSTWAMVRIHKQFPGLPISGLVREKLDNHLSERALEGEMEFFEENRTFERTYGYAWLLKLYAELRTWDDAGAPQWADNLAPLADLFSERMGGYLADLERPSRSGAHSNTAFSLAMMLDYARTMDDTVLEEAVVDTSRRLFLNDFGCPTAYEPWGSDFLSPCLEEAALMADVLEPGEFLDWFDEFMPPVTSREFIPLTTPVDVSEEEEAEEAGEEPAAQAQPEEPEAVTQAEEVAAETAEAAAAEAEEAGDEEADERTEEQRRADEALRSLASKSHLIGLAFIRADAMNRIAAALPAGDPRIDAYRALARLHGSMGFEAMFDADYAGSHWIGTFALKYLLTEQPNGTK